MYQFDVAPVKRKDISYPENSISEIGKSFSNFLSETKKKKLKKNREIVLDNFALEFEVGVVNHEHLIKPGSTYNPQGVFPNLFEPSRVCCMDELLGHYHGFINAVLTAYNNHHALVLSPDDFWLLIGLAVSNFIGNDQKIAEKYRHTFVEHEGKKELVVDGTKYGISPKSPKANKAGWPGFVAEMSDLVKTNTKTNISDLLTTPFSTSGSVEKTVMSLTLMETMKKYFSYKCMMLCGIPEITLEGKPEDYQSIIDRSRQLGDIIPDLKWYFERAEEHLQKIKKSVEGKPDKDFWRKMVLHIPEGSGGQVRFTGWIADFFPNLMGSTNGKDWKSMDLDDCNAPAVTQTPFKLDDQLYTMKTYDMILAGGFLGVAIDEKNKNAVRPAIGWMTYYKE